MAAILVALVVISVPGAPGVTANCQIPVTLLSPPEPPAPGATTTTSITPTTVDAATVAHVVCLESRLLQLGYAAIGTPDGQYGPDTEAAVRDFQTSRGLYPSGDATSLTLRQLGLRGADPTLLPIRVTLIGDSTMAAMRWYDEVNNASPRYDTIATGYDTILSAESCRRLVLPSCVGRIDPVTAVRWTPQSVLPLMQNSLRGRLGQMLVIMAGYDDLDVASTIDPIMTEALAQGVERVFWLDLRLTTTYPVYQRYYEASNRALGAARARYPQLTVLGWNDYSAGRTSWFERDGIHLTGVGALELGRFIRAAIDGRPSLACRTGQPNGQLCPAVRMGLYDG